MRLVFLAGYLVVHAWSLACFRTSAWFASRSLGWITWGEAAKGLAIIIAQSAQEHIRKERRS